MKKEFIYDEELEIINVLDNDLSKPIPLTLQEEEQYAKSGECSNSRECSKICVNT